MEKISFVKMSGTGNDFIVFDRSKNPVIVLSKDVIKRLCNRRNGIGADGIIVISNSSEADFLMEYYNADGSTGSLCGNGARCAIKFAQLSGRIINRALFKNNEKNFSGEILDNDNVRFYLNEPGNAELNFNLDAGGEIIKSSFIDTGSPHVVIKIEDVPYKDLDDFPVYDLGKEIRNHKKFMPAGTNVNFIKIYESKIFIRTYERGVEDETLACGTGSAASAIISFLTENISPPITLITKGGEELIVDFNMGNKKFESLSLTGSAKVIFTGEFLLNKFYN